MTASLPHVVGFLDELLEPERFTDYGPNGVQFPGRDEVSSIITAVSSSVELFETAAREGADLVLVHHGVFWGSGPGPVDAALKRRLAPLFAHDISLLAYHLPLDAHPQVGNNALLAAALGAQDAGPFAEHRGVAIGRRARFESPLSPGELHDAVQRATGRAPLHIDGGGEQIRELAIVTGAGSSYLPEAIALGADAFITGEPAERVLHEAREGAIHFLAAGHYATETFGIRRLGELLAKRFGVRHRFVDLPNPI